MPKSLDVLQNLVYYNMDDVLNVFHISETLGIDTYDTRQMLELYIQDPNDSFQTMSSYLWSNGYDLSESDIEDIVTDIKDKFDEAAAILDLRMDWRDWS